MKTRMSENSLTANAVVDKITQKEIILKCVKRIGEITQKGITYDTGIKRHVVSARVNDLIHDQELKVVGKVPDIAGSTLEVNKYSIRKESDPLNVFEKSWEEKFNELVQMLEDEHPDVLHKYNALYNREL